VRNSAVTVITPTHQRRQSVLLVLDALARQTCGPDFSVIVVCDGCTDGTQAAIRSGGYPFKLRVLETFPAAGPAAARNLALAAAETPILLFLDDDVIPDPRLVEEHVGHHQEQGDVVVIGPLLPAPAPSKPWIRWESDTLQQQYRDMQAGAWPPSPRQFYTGNASVARRHVVAAGGFDTHFKRGEDVDLAFRLHRAGLKFVFEPRARGVHIARRSFGSWANAAREYGRAELAMGPVWGERGLVDVKVLEFQRRNPVVRRSVTFGLKYPQAAPALIAAERGAARIFAGVGLWKLARGAYTAIFELAYWRGVDDCDGHAGTALRRIDDGRRQLVGSAAKTIADR
jgi:GT2 family glycosyltransferase